MSHHAKQCGIGTPWGVYYCARQVFKQTLQCLLMFHQVLILSNWHEVKILTTSTSEQFWGLNT